jgi:cytochrome c2
MASRIVLLTIWHLTMWIAVAHAQTAQEAQIEKGRQVVAQACTTCHTTLVRMVQVHKQTAEQWRDTVYFMISRGAQVMPGEIEAVTAFLVATSGRGPPATRGQRQQGVAGDGAAILQRNCQQCHELAIASSKPASEEWSAVISRMIAYGARLTPAEQQTLIGYFNDLKK